MPVSLRTSRHKPTPIILPMVALCALLATNARTVTAQSFGRSDESWTGEPEGPVFWLELADHPRCFSGIQAWPSNPLQHGAPHALTACHKALEGSSGPSGVTSPSSKWVGSEADGRMAGGSYLALTTVPARARTASPALLSTGASTADAYCGLLTTRPRSGHSLMASSMVDDARHTQWVVRDSEGSACGVAYVRVSTKESAND